MKRLLFVILSLQMAVGSLALAQEEDFYPPPTAKKTTSKKVAPRKTKIVRGKRVYAPARTTTTKPSPKAKVDNSKRDDFVTPTKRYEPPAIVQETPPPPPPPPAFSDVGRSNRHKLEPPPKSDATWWFGPRLLFWQESIKAERSGSKATFPSQFMGVTASASRRGKIGHSLRWLYSLGFEGSLGTVKASSSDPAFPDRLKNQPWVAAGVNPGLIYRGTAVTDIYLSVPVTLRKTFWTLEDKTLSLGREQSHSGGISVLTANRLTHSTTFVAGFVHQVQWKATEWLLGFDYHF